MPRKLTKPRSLFKGKGSENLKDQHNLYFMEKSKCLWLLSYFSLADYLYVRFAARVALSSTSLDTLIGENMQEKNLIVLIQLCLITILRVQAILWIWCTQKIKNLFKSLCTEQCNNSFRSYFADGIEPSEAPLNLRQEFNAPKRVRENRAKC